MTTLVLLLTACGGKGRQAEELLQEVRSAYMEMTLCSGHMELTADYGQRVYTYGLDFAWEKDGELTLTLTAPENIAGTTAHIARGETEMEYDGVRVETGPLDSGGLTPIDALPALLNYARDGYMAECVLENTGERELLHIICREPGVAPGKGIEGELWFAPETRALVRGEISEGGYTVIQSQFSDFAMG